MSVSIYHGSILDVRADAIVSPANSFMRHGALAGVIDSAARADATIAELHGELRPAHKRYCREQSEAPLVPTGTCYVTSAGALCRRYKAIIHAVGPIWANGLVHEESLLYKAYRAAFTEALLHDWTIVLPAISAGVFGVPIDTVARAALLAARVYTRSIGRQATFALVDIDHVAAFYRMAALLDFPLTAAASDGTMGAAQSTEGAQI